MKFRVEGDNGWAVRLGMEGKASESVAIKHEGL